MSSPSCTRVPKQHSQQPLKQGSTRGIALHMTSQPAVLRTAQRGQLALAMSMLAQAYCVSNIDPHTRATPRSCLPARFSSPRLLNALRSQANTSSNCRMTLHLLHAGIGSSLLELSQQQSVAPCNPATGNNSINCGAWCRFGWPRFSMQVDQ